MSNYGWFALKGICYLILIGFAVWYTETAWALLALALMPNWTSDE